MNTLNYASNARFLSGERSGDAIVVQKFGGTSVREIDKLSDFVRGTIGRKVVVVSALSGVTNLLHSLVHAVDKKQFAVIDDLLTEIKQMHLEFIQANNIDISLEPLFTDLESFAKDRRDFMMGGHIGEFRISNPEELRNRIRGWGELASSSIVAAYLRQQDHRAEVVDSTQVVRLTRDNLRGQVFNTVAIKRGIQDNILPLLNDGVTVVMAGYIATVEGDFATLGRGGSDFSAAILGGAIDADELQICKEVSGIMTANPKETPDAVTLSNLSYKAAAEGAAHGVNALHPKTISGLKGKPIPISVLNTLKPTDSGTLISASTNPGVSLVTSKGGFTIYHLYDIDMIDEPGWMKLISSCFADAGIDMDMDTSSRAGVTISVAPRYSDKQIQKLTSALGVYFNFAPGQNSKIISNASTVSLIGDDLDDSHQRIGANAMVNMGIKSLANNRDGGGHNVTYLFDSSVDRVEVVKALHAAFELDAK
jgi:aspartate kinase